MARRVLSPSFKASGYKPKLGDIIISSTEEYVVRGFSFEDGKIVLQLGKYGGEN